MSISTQKFLLILLILGIGVQTFTFISCTLHFPEENLSSSSAILGSISSSSNQNEPSSSSSAENQPLSSSSDFENSSSSLDEFSSSSDILSSSSDIDTVSSSSSNIVSSSSSSVPSSSSSIRSSSSFSSSSSLSLGTCTAKDNTQTRYCSGGILKEYGSVTQGDQTYKTIEIGTQTWMAENLNFTPTAGKSRCYAQGNGNGGDTWLAPDKPADQALIKANCDKYGRLYDWATAMTIPSSCNNSSCASRIQKKHQGICPNGWHIPDTLEWNTLRKFIEDEIFDNWEDVDFGWDVGTKLKAATGWKESSTSDKGVDGYGFAAIGSGYCVSCESLSDASGYYSGKEEEAHWWTATEYVNQYTKDAAQAYKSKITYNKKVMTLETEKKADYLYSVRCLKN